MKVFVTRHGQTSWNALGKIQGKTDIELNETGKNQARETREAIKNDNILEYRVSNKQIQILKPENED